MATLTDRLIANLDSDEFTVREQATAELERQGQQIEERLRKKLDEKPSLEVRQRIKQMLPKFGQRAVSPEVATAFRAVEARRKNIGISEAKKVLETLGQRGRGCQANQGRQGIAGPTEQAAACGRGEEEAPYHFLTRFSAGNPAFFFFPHRSFAHASNLRAVTEAIFCQHIWRHSPDGAGHGSSSATRTT